MHDNRVWQYYRHIGAEDSVLIVCDNKLQFAEDALINSIFANSLLLHFSNDFTLGILETKAIAPFPQAV